MVKEISTHCYNYIYHYDYYFEKFKHDFVFKKNSYNRSSFYKFK